MNIRVQNIVRVGDVCKAFEVTPMTVYHWRKKFKMPHITIPGERPVVLFDKKQVDVWAEEKGKVRHNRWPRLRIKNDTPHAA